MARIRSLKPGFFTNEHLCELSPWHRLCFAGLWTQADREGRMEDRPRRLKAAIFPYDSLDMDGLLCDLARAGFIQRYAADGVAYIAVVKFREHQRPKQDEYVSAIPAPLLEIPRGKDTAPRIDIGTLGQGDIGTEDRGEGIGATDVAPPAADGADSHLKRAADFAEAWNRLTEPPIPRCRDLTTKRKRHIRTRLTEHPLTEWEDVISRIQASRFCRGENDRGWVASFDWLVGSPDVAVKVLEGKYDDRAPVKPRQGHQPAQGAKGPHWSVVCQELHGGTCRNGWEHGERMQMKQGVGS